ncbi:Protein kinase [Mycena indigotica]|uniref:non-specific serine/threonine protein kinase n=1 Tax=Mycena indigotica TaxID=2126181 RepID=A0A8H6SYZ9_9AGAR|nr:Protein kinase [Mycena indigotica]KAF7307241.1 Protein kinase [Mycena indigotica]
MADQSLRYHKGGLHPVHLGDTFAQGRYQVINKLGSGISSTVWLVQDSKTSTYASLKILEARRSKSSTELVIMKHLNATFDAEDEGSKYVIRMLDHFIHTGPNGKHLCIVQELLGPPLSVDIDFYSLRSALPEGIASRIIGQILLAINYLHKRGIAHGDLHSGNFLLCLPPSLDIRDLGEAEEDKMPRTHNPSPHQPRYLVWPYKRSFEILQLCLVRPSIKLCDFSQSYMAGIAKPPQLGSPLCFRPPEGIIAEPPHATLASDIWALATVICQIITGGQLLFADAAALLPEGPDMILNAILGTLGKFPEPHWSNWTNRTKYLAPDEPVPTGYQVSFREWLTEEESAEALITLINSMLEYDEKSRISAGDIIHSDWMRKHCRLYMGDDVVLSTERRQYPIVTKTLSSITHAHEATTPSKWIQVTRRHGKKTRTNALLY